MGNASVETAGDAVFTRADALAAGVTVSQIDQLVRRRRWLVLRPGVYLDPSLAVEPVALSSRALAALERLGPDTAVSHRTAARLLGISFLGPTLDVVDITRPAAHRRTPVALPGLRALRSALPDSHVVDLDGIRATSAARTVVDLARTSSFRNGVVSADSALHLGLTTSDELRAVLADCRRWPGVVRARAVVDFADGRSESALESVSRVTFFDHELPVPELQVEIRDGRGLIGRVDFLFDDLVVGEADGQVKYAELSADLRTLWAEKRRQERLEEFGLSVVRWSWTQLMGDPAATVARVRAALRRSNLRRPA